MRGSCAPSWASPFHLPGAPQSRSSWVLKGITSVKQTRLRTSAQPYHHRHQHKGKRDPQLRENGASLNMSFSKLSRRKRKNQSRPDLALEAGRGAGGSKSWPKPSPTRLATGKGDVCPPRPWAGEAPALDAAAPSAASPLPPVFILGSLPL